MTAIDLGGANLREWGLVFVILVLFAMIAASNVQHRIRERRWTKERRKLLARNPTGSKARASTEALPPYHRRGRNTRNCSGSWC